MLRYAYLKDPDGLLVQLVEVEKNAKPRAGGVHHVGLGVKDMEAMRRFYGDVLGYTEVEHEFRSLRAGRGHRGRGDGDGDAQAAG